MKQKYSIQYSITLFQFKKNILYPLSTFLLSLSSLLSWHLYFIAYCLYLSSAQVNDQFLEKRKGVFTLFLSVYHITSPINIFDQIIT